MSNPVSLFRGVFRQKVGPYGTPDTSLPTFAGVASVTPNADGSFAVGWAAGSTTKTPLKYEIYVKKGSVSAAALFSSSANLVKIVQAPLISSLVFTEGDNQTYFANGEQYTFGVKAVDAFGFAGGPAVAIVSTAIGSGNLAVLFQTVAASLQATDASYAANLVTHSGQLVTMGNNLTTFAGQLVTFASQLTTMNSNNASLSAAAASIAASALTVDSAALAIASTVSALQAAASDISATQADFAATEASLQLLEAAFQASLVTLAQDISDLQALIADIDGTSTDLDALATSLNNLASTLAAIVVPPQITGSVTSGAAALVGVVLDSEVL